MNSGFSERSIVYQCAWDLYSMSWSNISQSYVARPLIYLVSYMAPVKIFMESERLRPVKLRSSYHGVSIFQYTIPLGTYEEG